jgi:hypothetical protein
MRSAALRILLLFLSVLVVPACTERTTIIDSLTLAGGQSFDWYVDAQNGNDTNAGTIDAPFKTITAALQRVVLGDSVKVLPGVYDAANGEVFPLTIRGGTRLIGDETNKGAGAVPTAITGDGPGPDSSQTATVYVRDPFAVGAEAVIAGFRITNTGAAGTRVGVLVGTGNTSLSILRDCTFSGSPDIALYMRDGSMNCIIRDNVFVSNGTGIRFHEGGFNTRVERNVLRNNVLGVHFSCPTSLGGSWDLGSVGGSSGGNELSSNTQNDILMTGGGSYNVLARNNFWDHVPPSGNDTFVVAGTWNLDSTGAALAPNPTP